MSDSIGARLRQARELRQLTIAHVSEATKLRTHYLQALENDDYSAIPSAAQARGFLRVYAEFLELNIAELLPPPTVVQPAPAAEPAAVAAPRADVAASAVSNLLAGLRARFLRPKKEAGQQGASLPAPAKAIPDTTVLSTAAPATPASSEAQTARRSQPDPNEVKKNAMS